MLKTSMDYISHLHNKLTNYITVCKLQVDIKQFITKDIHKVHTTHCIHASKDMNRGYCDKDFTTTQRFVYRPISRVHHTIVSISVCLEWVHHKIIHPSIHLN